MEGGADPNSVYPDQKTLSKTDYRAKTADSLCPAHARDGQNDRCMKHRGDGGPGKLPVRRLPGRALEPELIPGLLSPSCFVRRGSDNADAQDNYLP